MKLTVIIALSLVVACGQATDKTATDQAAAKPPEGSCPAGNGAITVPAGFCATVFADSVGHVRDLVVAPNGDVFVNTWSGEYFLTAPPPGGFLIAFRDTKHAGRADSVVRFGPSPATKGTGGTGIALYKGYLYAEAGPNIVRYRLADGQLVPDTNAAPEVVIANLPLTGDHPMHPFVIDSSGALYVDLGSASNSCQLKNRTLNSLGHKPCTELLTRGGIWKFDANKTGQPFSPAQRFATGIRNAVGITIDPADGSIWTTQHGRDQLGENFPKVFTLAQSSELPAEELVRLAPGGDFGWPECYFDGAQKKLMLAPEYGGDGKIVGDCDKKVAPEAFFPAHWAPDGLTFYNASMFPEHYRGGAFLAFHGSWNRSVGPQGGYNVVFQPFVGNKPSGAFEVFADGFAGQYVQPDHADHRPTDVTIAPDGALFITDDKGGRIWRVTYTGGAK